jgi:putative sigma-54 modulation protein
MELNQRLKDYIEEKSDRLSRFYDRIQKVDVVITMDSGVTSVEMIVTADRGHTFVAHDGGADAFGPIDSVVDKMERQLRRHKERHRNRKHPDHLEERKRSPGS